MEFISEQHTSMSTREFSKGPSKALRDCVAHPVMIKKYDLPVACLVSVELWNVLMRERSGFLTEQRLREVDEQR